MRLLAIAPCLALLGAASAASVPRAVYGRSVTTLSIADLNALAPYTEFARAAYCSVTTKWDCGGESARARPISGI